MEGMIVMEDTDRIWLQRELDEIKRRQDEGHVEVTNRLDTLPCSTMTERMVNNERGLTNHIIQHRERWSKTQIIVVVILGILGILNWIPKIVDALSK
jgi:hypothetical protein